MIQNSTHPETFTASREVALSTVLDTVNDSTLLLKHAQDVEPLPWSENQRTEKIRDSFARDPELVQAFISQGVEGLHGTRSTSLLSILKHGLLAPARHHQLNTPVISGEHYSQSTPREGIHVVHWVNAEGTLSFAEDATNYRNDGLSVNNYQEALGISDEFIEMVNPSLALRTHLENRKAKAKQLDTWLKSGNLSEEEKALLWLDFPVVIGVSLDSIDPTTISGVKSTIDGDCFIAADIPPENIKILFVPEEYITYVSKLNTTDASIVALERLRSLG